jgi:hypothetical protein
MRLFKVDKIAVILFIAGVLLISTMCWSAEKLEARHLVIHGKPVILQAWKLESLNKIDINIEGYPVLSVEDIPDNQLDQRMRQLETILERLSKKEFEGLWDFAC